MKPKRTPFIIFFLFIILLFFKGNRSFCKTDLLLPEALLLEQHFLYQGAFKVPHIQGESTLSWGGSTIAYNEINHSLFIRGHDHFQLVGEITIPTPRISNSIEQLPTASILQPCTDITQGNLGNIGAEGTNLETYHNIRLGGLLVYGDSLIGTMYAYYDHAYDAKRSHFIVGKDFSIKETFQGCFTLGDANPGLVAGYMTPIPLEWQSLLGGTVLTGQGGIPIISRSSMGPSAFSFNPDLLGVVSPTPATGLVYYPQSHPTLGEWINESHANPLYNMATSIDGIVFPVGTASILFFGRTGLGIPKYGTGTENLALVGRTIPGTNEVYIYDPADQYQGNHAWPYSYYVWAYNAHDLSSVYKGRKDPWEIIPYAHWSFDLPFKDEMTDTCEIGGLAYDPSMNRIYLSQLRADEDRPIIHVFDVVNPSKK